MTLSLADPMAAVTDRPRRTGMDFADEAARAAAAARFRAEAARVQAAESPRREAQRLHREAAAHDLDARCHEEAVAAVLGMVVMFEFGPRG